MFSKMQKTFTEGLTPDPLSTNLLKYGKTPQQRVRQLPRTALQVGLHRPCQRSANHSLPSDQELSSHDRPSRKQGDAPHTQILEKLSCVHIQTILTYEHEHRRDQRNRSGILFPRTSKRRDSSRSHEEISNPKTFA